MLTKNIDYKNNEPAIIRFFAQVISYIFHPLFIPLYICLFLIYLHPSYFSGVDATYKFWFPFIVAQLSIFYPALSVFLLKKLGFISSIYLHNQKDRIIPLIASGIFYFWLFQVCKNHPAGLNPIFASTMLGVFLGSSVALMANIYLKISLHAIGVGGLVGVFFEIMQSNTMLMTWPLCIALFIAGLVCTSRLLVSNHTSKEIYVGFLAGLICQIVAAIAML